jgi:hypothetical protein
MIRLLLPQGKKQWYPLDRRLSGPQSQSGHCGEEKISHPWSGIEPQPPNLLSIATPTELYQQIHN